MEREELERQRATLSLSLFALSASFQGGRLAHFCTVCVTQGCTNLFWKTGSAWLLLLVPFVFVALTLLLFYFTADVKSEPRLSPTVNRRAVTLTAAVGGIFGFLLPTILRWLL